MKYIKKFETFSEDNTHEQTTPKHNIATNDKARKYVEDNFTGADFFKLYDILGIEVPKEQSGEAFDKACDEVKERAIKHFIENPEEMTDASPEIKKMDVQGGGNTPVLQNIGGDYTQRHN